MTTTPEKQSGERVARVGVADFALRGVELLREQDPTLFGLIEAEYTRQASSLAMVASCSTAHPSVLACEGTFTSNVTAEGYPGHRHHAGCKYVDRFEQLAIDRAKELFSAEHANVQPHSGAQANMAAYLAVIKPGDTLMGQALPHGGHLTHGAAVAGQHQQRGDDGERAALVRGELHGSNVTTGRMAPNGRMCRDRVRTGLVPGGDEAGSAGDARSGAG
jgi:glycine hydroxymethyltransferase